MPVSQEDRLDHEPRLALPEQQVTERLGQKIPPGKPDQYRYAIDGFAVVSDGMTGGNSAEYAHDAVVALLAECHLEQRRELAAVVWPFVKVTN